MKQKTTDLLEISNVKPKPLTDDKGRILNDLQFVNKAIEMLDDYERENGEPLPISLKFQDYLRELKEESVIKETNSETGEVTVKPNPNFNIVAYKQRTIEKTIPDYGILKNVK